MTCSNELRILGKEYPRTCADCGMGPCRDRLLQLPHLERIPEGAMGFVYLESVEARWRMARMAGEDAVDGENGWDSAKIRAMTASFNDIPNLVAEIKKLRQKVAELEGEPKPRRALIE